MNRTTKKLILPPYNICGNVCKGDRILKRKTRSFVPTEKPNINGQLVWGESIPSGTSDELPDISGYTLDIDFDALSFTATEIWRRQATDFINEFDGQKVLTPSFDAFSERCFIRGRSTGGSGGASTVTNGILEIDPLTGNYIGQVFSPWSGGAFTDAFEISKGGTMYVADTDGDGVTLYDLNFNSLGNYTGLANGFSETFFGVGPSANIVLKGDNDNVVQYFSEDKSVDFTVTLNDLTTSANNIRYIRCSDTHILLSDDSDIIHYYNISSRTVDWEVSVADTRSIGFDFNGDILVGRNPTSAGRVRKLSKVDGSTLWDVNVADSGTTSPAVTQVGNLTDQILYAWSGVAGEFFLIKNDGTVFSGVGGFGRGHVGVHPFTGDRITNFINE